MALPLDPKWRDWLQKIKSKLSAKSEVDGNGCIMWTGYHETKGNVKYGIIQGMPPGFTKIKRMKVHRLSLFIIAPSAENDIFLACIAASEVMF